MGALIGALTHYFDLRPDDGVAVTHGLGKAQLPWLTQYFALALGVLLEGYLNGASWRSLGGSGVTGLILLPAVYRRCFAVDVPGIVQYCAIVIGGAGWHSLLSHLG
jgi:hypothetical protein